MLLPAQVIPFLQHEVAAVREHASDYLAKAHDPSPATADDFWRAIDHFGIEQSTRLLSDFGDVPATEYSYRRTLDSLRAAGDEDIAYHLHRALTWLDFPLLMAHRDELLSEEKLLPHVRDHLRERIELSGRPLDALWDALLQLSAEVDGKYWGEFDDRTSLRLIEAAAGYGDAAAVRALDRLRARPGEDYMEIFCVQLLGKIRYAPATEALVERLIIPDADILNQEAGIALARIGTVDVIGRLEAVYPSQEWGARLFVCEPLGRIKRPETERSLLRLLEGEREEDLRTHIAWQLGDLCTTEGLDVIRQMVVHDAFDPQVADVDDLLLTVATMTGYDFPESAKLRVWVDQRNRQRERRLRDMGEVDGLVRVLRDRWLRGEPPWPATGEPTDDGPPPGVSVDDFRDDGYRVPPGHGTYRREEPKVGRNDSCPCGSGKKYKKCCLKEAKA